MNDDDIRTQWVGLQEQRAELRRLLDSIHSNLQQQQQSSNNSGSGSGINNNNNNESGQNVSGQNSPPPSSRQPHSKTSQHNSSVNHATVSDAERAAAAAAQGGLMALKAEDRSKIEELKMSAGERAVLQVLAAELGEVVLANHQRKIIDLKAELERLQKRNFDLGLLLDDTSAVAERQRGDVAASIASQSELNARIYTLGLEINSLTAKIHEANRIISDNDAKIEKQWVKLRTSQEQVAALEVDLSEVKTEHANDKQAMDEEVSAIEAKIAAVDVATKETLTMSQRQQAYIAGQIVELNTELERIRNDRVQLESLRTSQALKRKELEGMTRDGGGPAAVR